MEKIYLIVRILGETGAVVGPLPYDMPEYMIRLEQLRAESEIAFDPSKAQYKGKLLKFTDISWQCEKHSKRPAIVE